MKYRGEYDTNQSEVTPVKTKPPRHPCKQRSECCEVPQNNKKETPVMSEHKSKSRRDSEVKNKHVINDNFSTHSEQLPRSKPKQSDELPNTKMSRHKGSSRNSYTGSARSSLAGNQLNKKWYELSAREQYRKNRSSSQSDGKNIITGDEKQIENQQTGYERYINRDRFGDRSHTADHAKHEELKEQEVQSEKSSEILNCGCGVGYSSMWLNHFDREEKQRYQRKKKMEDNQHFIFTHPQQYGNEYNNINDIKKNELIEKSTKDQYGNSLVTEMNGCPIQKVHKLKAKKREKLKKYLYHGRNKDDREYEYNKNKLQN